MTPHPSHPPSGPEPRDERAVRGSGGQTVYQALKRDIIEMVLAPGEALDETRLSTRFAMSRTPVREALVRLAAEGLVTTLPNRNTIVAAIDFADLPEFFDALTLMYRVTTRLAAQRRTEADLAAIRLEQARFAAAVGRDDAMAMIATNRDSHTAIAAAARTRYYADLFARLLDEGRRLLRLYYRTFGDHLPAPYAAEHDLIIAAIEARDAEQADALAAGHAAQIVAQIRDILNPDLGASLALDRPGLLPGRPPGDKPGLVEG